MDDLLEELGIQNEETEKYVYLGHNNQPKKQISLNVHLNIHPSSTIQLSCDPNDSLNYLRFFICETIEKYSAFSGLNNLYANSLSRNQQILPKKGSIGEFTANGDNISCDITSQDIWLDIRITSIEFQVMIQFEIKLPFNTTIENLKGCLVDIANEILRAKNINANYEEPDLAINKIQVEKETLTNELECPILNENELIKKLVRIEKDKLLSEEFDHLDRYVWCFLDKRKKIDPNAVNPPVEIPVNNKPESHAYETLPIRGLRLESTMLQQTPQVKEKRKKTRRDHEFDEKPNFCACLMM